MTVGIGYPDYQDLPNWRGQVYNASAVPVTIAAPKLIEEYVTNFASVYMRAQMTGGTGVKIELDWYTDSTKSFLVLSQVWQISGGGTELSVIVPAIANFLSCKLSTTNAGTQTVSFTLAPTNVQVPSTRYPGPVFSSSALTTPIAGTGVLSVNVARMAEGEGYLSVNVSGHATSFNVFVQELDQTGTPLSTVFRQESTGQAINNRFKSGSNPLTFNITNEDAAAHNFDYYVQVLGQ
jgi:hypothetical protein